MLGGFLSTVFARKPANRPSVKPHQFRPNMEPWNGFVLTTAVYLDNNDIIIDARDFTPHTVTVNYEIYSGVGYYRINDNGTNYYFHNWNARGGDVVFKGGYKDDFFANNTIDLRTTAYGFDGNDKIYGSTYQDDYIDGGYGYDELYGLGGNDTMYAGWDRAGGYINGGDGFDTMYGSYGSDTMWGGDFNDTMYGFDGRDFLYGESGSDLMYGGAGDDYLDGGLHWDRLYGEGDSDSLNGGDEYGYADYLSGGAGVRLVPARLGLEEGSLLWLLLPNQPRRASRLRIR